MVKVRLRLLGGVKRLLGRDVMDIEVNGEMITLRDLLALLASMSIHNSTDSILAPSNLLIAINGKEASLLGGLDAIIKDGDQVSILTVVHGGCI
ncbi:MAG: MoaD/ThiS family protein [Candidatus Nitrosocaldus sp.]